MRDPLPILGARQQHVQSVEELDDRAVGLEPKHTVDDGNELDQRWILLEHRILEQPADVRT